MKKLLCLPLALLLAVSCNKEHTGPFNPTSAKDFEGTVWVREGNESKVVAFSGDGARVYLLDESGHRIRLQSRGDYTFIDGTVAWEEKNYEIVGPNMSRTYTAYSGKVEGNKIELHSTENNGDVTLLDQATFIRRKKYDFAALRSVWEPEVVDLGLVVNGRKVKWASWNIGASREYEYGDSFAWGETAAKRNYDWSTYKFKGSGTGYHLTKYCPATEQGSIYWDYTAGPDGPDGLTALLADDDSAVADKRLSGKWRIPTSDELRALLNLKDDTENYIVTPWETYLDADGKEVKDIRGRVIHGCRITRKSTGASLFIPAAGTWEGTTSGINSDKEGYVWSSGLGTIAPTYALSFKFDSKNTGTSLSMYYIYRYYGLPIRPVCE